MTHVRNRLLFAGVPVAAPAIAEPSLSAPETFTRTRLRSRMEEAVERFLAALDAMDGDPDLEAVCEDEGGGCEDEGADIGDLEPWLGRAETGLGAVQFSRGDYSDLLDGELLLSPVEAL